MLECANGMCANGQLIADRESLGTSTAVERSLQKFHLPQTRRQPAGISAHLDLFYVQQKKGAAWHWIHVNPTRAIYMADWASHLLTSSLAAFLSNYCSRSMDFFQKYLRRSIYLKSTLLETSAYSDALCRRCLSCVKISAHNSQRAVCACSGLLAIF